MGPAGTITPFHHDLTNNFMAQVIGRKRVKIAPSWDMPLMDNHLHCFSQVDGRDHAARPAAAARRTADPRMHPQPGRDPVPADRLPPFVQGLDITVTVSFTNFVFDNDFHSFYTTYGPV